MLDQAPVGDSNSVEFILAELDTVNPTQDFTVAGFGVPAAAAFWFSPARSGQNPTPVCSPSFGFTDGASQFCISSASKDSDSETDRRASDVAVFEYINHLGGGVLASGALNSMISGGVRLNLSGVSSAHYVLVALFSGDWEADARKIDLATQNNTADISCGFEANLLLTGFHVGAVNNSGLNTPAIHTRGMMSWDGSTIRQGVHAYRADDGSTSTTQGDIRNDGVASHPTDRYAEVTDVNSSRIQVTSRGADMSAWDMICLSLKAPAGEEVWVGVLDLPTSTGDQNMTGTGAPMPFAGMMIPTMIDTVNTIKTDGQASAFGISAFDADEEHSLFFADEDGVGGGSSNTMSEYAAKALALDDHQHNPAFDATLKEFIAGGWTLTVSDADATARKALCAMFG